MPINYNPVGWDTTKFVNPTNMNQMDNGIKAACDGVDALTEEVADVNESLGERNIKTYNSLSQMGLTVAKVTALNVFPTNSFISLEISGGDANTLFSAGVLPIANNGVLTIQTSSSSGKATATFVSYERLFTAYSGNYANGFNAWSEKAQNSDVANTDFYRLSIPNNDIGIALTFKGKTIVTDQTNPYVIEVYVQGTSSNVYAKYCIGGSNTTSNHIALTDSINSENGNFPDIYMVDDALYLKQKGGSAQSQNYSMSVYVRHFAD